jgi:hypothetical protein
MLDGLLSAYPAISGKIRNSVSWRTIGYEDDCHSITVLGVLRSLMLTSLESTVNFIVYWKPEDEQTYGKWKSLLTSPHLRRVRVFDPRVLLGEKISDDVRTLKIMLPDDANEEVIWPLFDKNLLVPKNLEKLEIEAATFRQDDFPMSLVTGGAQFSALFFAVPKLYFIVNPRPEFWDAFEAFDNVVELSLVYFRWSLYPVPLDWFANLRKLQLDASLVRGQKFFDLDVVVPQVQTLDLTFVDESAFRKNGVSVWEHLARLFPNVVNLSIHVDSRSFKLASPDVFAVTIPEQFTRLEKLKIRDVPLEFTGVQGMLERFEAVRPGGFKEMKIYGMVYYARPKCYDICSKVARWVKQKRRQNRKLTFDVTWCFPEGDVEGHLYARQRLRESYYLFKFSQP